MNLFAGMGVASTSFMGALLGKRSTPPGGLTGETHPDTRSAMSLPPVPPSGGGTDTIHFLERCHALGAAGIQAKIMGDPRRLRARAEELGMWIEAMIAIRGSSPESLEAEIAKAKEAGCTLARDGLLGGRRYESFGSLEGWQAWLAESHRQMAVAIPIFDKHAFTLAIENHKDWTLEQFVDLFRSYSSEYFGACIDFGNNLSLLDDIMETIEAAAPYVRSMHLKDLAVAPCRDGFLLSEVPLGKGIVDLPRALRVLREANPAVHLVLEMITRDPLRVTCLKDSYWTTFPDRSGLALARTLRFVQDHASPGPLTTPEDLSQQEHTRLEEENIRLCLDYARRQAEQKG